MIERRKLLVALRGLSCLALSLVLLVSLATAAPVIPQVTTRMSGDGVPDTAPEVHELLDQSHQHGGVGGHLSASSANVQLVGKVRLTNVPGGISDVGAFRGYAYLGAFSPECAGRPGAQGTGVHIVDVRNPSNPVKVGFAPAHANSYVGEGVQVIHMATGFFEGDILVHNNEGCNTAMPYEGGVSLWNVTDPLEREKLAGGVGDNTPALAPNIGGVHSVHSAFAWYVPETGRAFVMMADNQEVADVDILEITDPRNPVLISETGFNDWPSARSPLANGDTVFNHDFQVKKIGDRWLALVSYWDAGWVILDVTDPATPVFVNDSNYPTPDRLTGFAIPEGNAHQAWWDANNEFILGTDEDFSATRTNCEIRTGANAGATPCGEFSWTPDLDDLYATGFEGITVYGGLGCDAATVPPASSAPGTGPKVAVFSRGDCFFSTKVENGQNAGYDLVAIGQSHAGSRGGLLPDGFICGGQGHDFDERIPAICIGHRAMHQLFNDNVEYSSAEGADITIGALGERIFTQGGVFDAWGYVHLLNANNLEEIDAYAVPQALDPAFMTGFGVLSVHEVQTDPRTRVNLAYVSYYDAGFRVLKFDGRRIREVGHFIDTGGNDFWGIEPIQLGNRGVPLVPTSDRDFGLYIFRYTGD